MGYHKDSARRSVVGAIGDTPLFSGADDPELRRTRAERAYGRTLNLMPNVSMLRMTGHRPPMIMSGRRAGPMPMGAVSDHRGTCSPAALASAKAAAMAQARKADAEYARLKKIYKTNAAGLAAVWKKNQIKLELDRLNKAVASIALTCTESGPAASTAPRGGGTTAPRGATGSPRPAAPKSGQLGRPVKTPGATPPPASPPTEPAPQTVSPMQPSGGGGVTASTSSGSGGGSVMPPTDQYSDGMTDELDMMDQLDQLDKAVVPATTSSAAAPVTGPAAAAPSASSSTKKTVLLVAGGALALYLLTRSPSRHR